MVLSSDSVHSEDGSVVFYCVHIYICVCVCVCVYTHHIFIHSSIDRHLGWFHVLAIVNSASVNIGCIYVFEQVFSLSICLGVGLVNHVVILFSVFKETLYYF